MTVSEIANKLNQTVSQNLVLNVEKENDKIVVMVDLLKLDEDISKQQIERFFDADDSGLPEEMEKLLEGIDELLHPIYIEVNEDKFGNVIVISFISNDVNIPVEE